MYNQDSLHQEGKIKSRQAVSYGIQSVFLSLAAFKQIGQKEEKSNFEVYKGADVK